MSTETAITPGYIKPRRRRHKDKELNGRSNYIVSVLPKAGNGPQVRASRQVPPGAALVEVRFMLSHVGGDHGPGAGMSRMEAILEAVLPKALFGETRR